MDMGRLLENEAGFGIRHERVSILMAETSVHSFSRL
jgi:hypothetical protein